MQSPASNFGPSPFFHPLKDQWCRVVSSDPGKNLFALLTVEFMSFHRYITLHRAFLASPPGSLRVLFALNYGNVGAGSLYRPTLPFGYMCSSLAEVLKGLTVYFDWHLAPYAILPIDKYAKLRII